MPSATANRERPGAMAGRCNSASSLLSRRPPAVQAQLSMCMGSLLGALGCPELHKKLLRAAGQADLRGNPRAPGGPTPQLPTKTANLGGAGARPTIGPTLRLDPSGRCRVYKEQGEG